MNSINIIRSALFLLLILMSQTLKSQSLVNAGLLPRINVSTELSDKFKLTNIIESRQVVLDNTEEGLFNSDYVLTDISSIVSYKLAADKSANVGYTLRIRDGEIIHRFLQQFNIVRNFDALRIGHRFATDQTFSKNNSLEFRTRYRISIELPLSGDKIDPREFYLKFGNEYLGSFEKNNADLEIRIIPLMGYEINKENKIEFGVDYRVSEFIKSDANNQIWLSIAWFTTIKPNFKAQRY